MLALVILTGGLYLICGYLFSDHLDTRIGWWDPILFAYVASGSLALVGGGSIYKITQLRSGGPRVARSLGDERVDHGTKDPELRRLVNVVEEMSIASGLPTPQVWVLEQEQGINAFAAGLHPGNAVVAKSFTRPPRRAITRFLTKSLCNSRVY